MTIINLYKYIEGNSSKITPIQKNDTDEVYCYRLVADKEKLLTNGNDKTNCIDIPISEKSNWSEVVDTSSKKT